MRCSKLLEALTVLLLVLLVGASTALATPPTVTGTVSKLTMEDSGTLVLVLGTFSHQTRAMDIGLVLLPPIAGSLDKADEAKHFQFAEGLILNYSAYIRIRLEVDSIGSPLKAGDRLVIEALGGSSLPEGTWQLFLIDEGTSYPAFGISWIIGHISSENYQISFTNAGVADPLLKYGFRSRSDTTPWFGLMIGVEVLILALIVFIISRNE